MQGGEGFYYYYSIGSKLWVDSQENGGDALIGAVCSTESGLIGVGDV